MVLSDGEGRELRLLALGECYHAVVTTDWFTARSEGGIRAGLIHSFALELGLMNEQGFGSTTFVGENEWVHLTLVMAKRGHLHVTVRMQSAPDYLDEVRVFMNLRQSDLPQIADAVRALGPA